MKEAASPPAVYRSSAFKLGDGVLETCEDIEEVFSHPLDGGRDFSGLRKGMTEIQSSCAEQFAGRTVLASCTIERDFDGGPKRLFRQAYYSTTLIGDSDALMQSCLETKGKWFAVPRDSLEWAQARADEMRRKRSNGK